MNAAEFSERGLIASFRELFAETSERTLLGIGDDAAVLRTGSPTLVITTDAFSEWVHFRVDHIAPDQLGEKMVTATVSDCAAMGCVPRWLTVALAAPSETPAHRIHSIYEGLKRGCERYDCDLVGGDTVRAMSDLCVSLTAVGEPCGESVLTRSGAAEGDDLYVTGRLGGPAAAILLLREAPERSTEEAFREAMFRFLHPEARIAEGRLLATRLGASSAIDISDGLSADVAHLAEESRVGFRVEREELPVLPSALAVAEALQVPGELFALHGGEEFELLFTLDPGREEEVYAAFDEAGLPVPTRIGAAAAAEDGILLVDRRGDGEPLIDSGFDHFAGEG
ncbi:MAG: thiamine-phosphate kinase [Candidatus Eisenbacteria bacterium]|nr:thiamine-phosphate kinase [Candidatus Eisenbacteria bacterium]